MSPARPAAPASHGFALGAPTGPFPVGRRSFDLVDAEREDPFARRPGTARRLAIWAWYPAAAVAADRPAAYLPGAWRSTSWLWGLGASRLRTDAREGAAPAPGTHPLVLFSPSANPPLCYAGLLQELASHGYVAVGISHTYECLPLSVFADARPRLARLASLGGALAAPGKRPFGVDLRQRAAVVATKADDIGFVRAALSARAGAASGLPAIDGDRAAVVGHSFGGGAALEVCQRPQPPLAGVSLDGGLWRAPETVSPPVPFLQIFGEHPEYAVSAEEAVRGGYYRDAEYAAADRATTVGAWQALHAAARPGYSALVRGAPHTSFCDWPLLPLRRWSPARSALRGHEGRGTLNAVSRALLAYLDVHLGAGGGDPWAALEAIDGLTVCEPELLFGAGGSRAPEAGALSSRGGPR